MHQTFMTRGATLAALALAALTGCGGGSAGGGSGLSQSGVDGYAPSSGSGVLPGTNSGSDSYNPSTEIGVGAGGSSSAGGSDGGLSCSSLCSKLTACIDEVSFGECVSDCESPSTSAACKQCVATTSDCSMLVGCLDLCETGSAGSGGDAGSGGSSGSSGNAGSGGSDGGGNCTSTCNQLTKCGDIDVNQCVAFCTPGSCQACLSQIASTCNDSIDCSTACFTGASGSGGSGGSDSSGFACESLSSCCSTSFDPATCQQVVSSGEESACESLAEYYCN